jgi:hypothetical protein
MPGTPAHEHYDELQRSLCVALNSCCHYDAARLVAECDQLLWRHVLLPALVRDVTGMRRRWPLAAQAGRRWRVDASYRITR